MSQLTKMLLLAVVSCMIACSSAISFCGEQTYDREKNICCGGKLHPQLVNTKCCPDTGKVYDATKAVCCGKVIPTTSPATTECCKKNGISMLYDISDQTCCNGHIHNTKRSVVLPGGYTYKEDLSGFCCGNDFVDTTTKEDGHYMKCCNYDDYYPQDGKPYNSKTHMCCDGRIALNGIYSRCCGQNTYNLLNNICCDVEGTDRVLPKLDNGQNECCAKAPGGVVSLQKQVCVEGEPQERLCFSDDDKPGFGCCARYISYNKTTHHCCGDRVLAKDTECCAGNPVLPGEICCGPAHGRIRSSDSTHDTCCYTDASLTTYNNAIQTCSHGEVSTRTLCGGKEFNPKKKICCAGMSQPLLRTYTCCGQRLFNPKYATCCSGVRVSGKNVKCQ